MMKMTSIILYLIITFVCPQNKSWTDEQLKYADTGRQSALLNEEEKEIIKYLNLCRVYPKDFARIELANYYGIPEKGYDLKKSEYKKSLISTLNKVSPIDPLTVDSVLIEDAKCFSSEIGTSGRKGHERIICGKRNSAECISYSRHSGRDIVLQLLIDHNVKSLGHRKICLDSGYTRIGCSISKHLKYEICAVLELGR